MTLEEASWLKVGQIIRVRSYESLFLEYSHLIDRDGDFAFESGFVFKHSVGVLSGQLCRVLQQVSGSQIAVEVINPELPDYYGGIIDLDYHMFEQLNAQQFTLTCPICTTVDGIYISQHMSDLLKNICSFKKLYVDDKLYYKINGYYYPSSAVYVL